MTERKEKFSNLVQQELSYIIRTEIDIPPDTLVTVTDVEVTPDLKKADVYISVLPDNKRGSALELLRKTSGILRSSLAKKIHARKTPQLMFQIDQREAFSQEVDQALDELDTE